MRHGDDFEEAIVRSVNDTKDNDTIAAIVGSVLGALHGKSAIPPRWLGSLLGRTQASDDGRVFNLISEAHERWWILET
jgi:ADP-ribosylglycohydrolase